MKTCYVIEEVRGIADLVPADEMGLKGPGMILTRINIPKQHRGQGYARTLLKEILDDADAEGMRLYLEILPSGGLDYVQLVAWYTRNGFEPILGGAIFRRKPVANNYTEADEELHGI